MNKTNLLNGDLFLLNKYAVQFYSQKMSNIQFVLTDENLKEKKNKVYKQYIFST